MTKRLAIELFLVLVVGLALGLIGPFGTFENPIGARVAYWMVFGLAGYAIFRPLIIVGSWISEVLNIPRFVAVGLALIIAAIPMTLLVAGMLWRYDIAQTLRWHGLGQLYLQVWLIGFLVNGVFMLIFRDKPDPTPADARPDMPQPAPAATPDTPDTPSARFEERLPLGFGRLLALKGEDHYVRAIGDGREELVLFRLRDAIGELGTTDGLQVHRSWWVAREAVATVRRNGREATLILVNGTEVAVSRDRMPALRAAGWI